MTCQYCKKPINPYQEATGQYVRRPNGYYHITCALKESIDYIEEEHDIFNWKIK